ncbi:MAG: methyltransferase domain-containing protein [Chloroflexi bacterium]|nr:methyltransferase domain-containing protein [Chloroflexota bacterium]
MSQTPTLTEMPLYKNVDRISVGLEAQGIGPADPIPLEALGSSDQWHYHGTEALALAGARLEIGRTSNVLDIGSGVGGPARYLADRYGCHVTAIEVQPNLNDIAVDLTRRSGLASLVTHVCGDAATHPLPAASFDVAVSWLAVLHIPGRPELLRNIAGGMRTGGKILIEDLCQRKAFAETDLHDLRHVVYGVTVTPVDEYVADLTNAGFAEVQAEDLTPDWAPFAAHRLRDWRANHADYARVYGEAAYAGQELFYTVIDRLYARGSLGGVRLTATRT